MTDINLQPLLDLIGKAGAETTEFKKARSAGLWALVLFWLGVVGMVAGLVTSAFGSESKVGVLAGAASAIAGVIAKAMASAAYSASRADTKQAAADVVAATVAAQPPAAAPK